MHERAARRTAKDVGVLRNVRHLAVQLDAGLLHLLREPQQRRQERALPGARCANDDDQITSVGREVDRVQHGRVVGRPRDGALQPH